MSSSEGMLAAVALVVVAASQLCEAHHDWAACFPLGRHVADQFAAENGLVVVSEVIPDSNCFQLTHDHKAVGRTRTKREAMEAARQVIAERRDIIDWAEEQYPLIRVKRSPPASGRDRFRENSVVDDDGRGGGSIMSMNDPMWSKMWYLNREGGHNMDVEGAWRQGFTGRGVAVTILDDGIEKDHPDLIQNYDPLASTDINDNDSDPNPRYDYSDSNRHGTRCAGQVAASPNNSLCAVGIAFNAQIGGIRMLDGQVSDAVEARSLSYNPDHIDIYSSSWGPNDDGKTVDGPGKLAFRAFKNGITRGREGKGSIFVWASGNGGRYKDNCNCDGYATSVYTITVSSTSESGQIPWYSEACSSTLATTYSSGTSSERQIVTTDLHHGCTMKHTGTSASAPMAAAIIALALEANPDLTWRDVQHIIVRTSRPLDLKAPDWTTNAMGRKVSHSYGYGLMDATAMVSIARNWRMMPKQMECTVTSPYYYKEIPAMGYETVTMEVDCPRIKKLEHVKSPIHVSAGRKRGDLRIYLQSPSGTRSTLLDVRPHDFSSSGFIDWPFMSTHFWGEDPSGTWHLEVHNDAYSKYASEAKFFKWTLELLGTEYDPNDDNDDEKFNVVRETPEEGIFGRMAPEIKEDNEGDEVPEVEEEQATTSTPPPPPPRGRVRRGCISKQNRLCTQNTKHCRTFDYRNVASLMCECTPICLEVATLYGSGLYNMQCNMDDDESQTARMITDSRKPPIYCSFIPFLGYKWSA